MPRPPRKLEKAKDFKGAISRLVSELKRFKVLIILSLVLAALGSILSIFAPNKLSDLTDEISKGLMIKNDKMEEISAKISENLTEEKMTKIIPKILSLDLSEDRIVRINSSFNDEDKKTFGKFLNNIESNPSNLVKEMAILPDNVLTRILKSSTYNDITISIDDKKEFIKCLNSNSVIYPESISKIIFPEFTMSEIVVSSSDQVKYLSVMSTVNSDTDKNVVQAKMSELPESIKEITKPVMNMDTIKGIALFLVILYLLSALFNYIESISMTTVSNNFARVLRSKISTKINKLPLKYFDKTQSGDVLSRVTNDVDMIAQTMNQSLASLVSAITLFVGSIIMMFVTNWVMAITAIGASLFGFMFMFAVLGKSQKYFTARQVELGNLNGHIEEVYSGLNVVKAYNGQKSANEVFDLYNQNVYNANRKSQFLSGLMMPMMNFIGNFGYVAVCIVGALLAMNGKISFGVIVAFITYVRLFTSPLSQIGQAMTSLQSTAAASERVFEFVDEEEMTDESSLKETLKKDEVKGKIEFKNVSFTYDGNDHPTITNFSAVAKPGQKVAIVGPTGAGKTTMVNLLMKFYNITDGDILIDDKSIKELTRENIHSLFTMVLQDTWLFNGTIKENIIYNRKNITNKKVKEVCDIVGLDHFIKTLPNGYDSVVSDSDSVSSGQRQLLTIARGILSDAPFIILDEATSNVDTRTEELVQKAMDTLTEGRTSFIIAHRLSTIKNADLILVMKDGNIIEQGTHKELLKKKGFYADLYNSQFEL